MENTEIPPDETARPAAAGVKRRRKTAPRKKSPVSPGGPAAKMRSAKALPARKKQGQDPWREVMAGRASAAGAKIVRLSRDSAGAARRALGNIQGLSKKTAKRLARDWRTMTPRRRAQLVATLIAALGAAAAPLVARQVKKR